MVAYKKLFIIKSQSYPSGRTVCLRAFKYGKLFSMLSNQMPYPLVCISICHDLLRRVSLLERSYRVCLQPGIARLINDRDLGVYSTSNIVAICHEDDL